MNTRTKCLLILGAGSYYMRAIQEVRKLGYRVIVVDRNPASPGFAIADGYEVVDVIDKKQVLRVARENSIDGIMPINDFGVRTAAYVAQELGLVGIDSAAAVKATQKSEMRECWSQVHLSSPEFKLVKTLKEAHSASAKLKYPLVMKPSDSGGGGRGVSIMQSESDITWSFEFARPFARDGNIVIEEFLDGIEMTIESLSYRGSVHVLAMSDKEKPLLRTRVATSLNYPAFFPVRTLNQVQELVQKAVLALGIFNGPAHTEVIVTSNGPVLVETGARGGGGHIFSTIVQTVSGVNFVQETAKILVGASPDIDVKYQHGCVYRFFTPSKGVIKAIHGLDEARKMPGVLDVGVTKKPGDYVGDLVNGLERSGFAVVAGDDRAEAVHRADEVQKTIVFEMMPENNIHSLNSKE